MRWREYEQIEVEVYIVRRETQCGKLVPETRKKTIIYAEKLEKLPDRKIAKELWRKRLTIIEQQIIEWKSENSSISKKVKEKCDEIIRGKRFKENT